MLITQSSNHSCQIKVQIPEEFSTSTTTATDQTEEKFVESSPEDDTTTHVTSIVNHSFLKNDKIPLEDLSGISNNKSSSDMNLNMSLLTAAADYIKLLYIIAGVLVAAIAAVVVLKIVHKKIDYSVDKSGRLTEMLL